jgi:hypothetical protein
LVVAMLLCNRNDNLQVQEAFILHAPTVLSTVFGNLVAF